MPAIAIRQDRPVGALRRLARLEDDGRVSSRLLALAAVLDGHSREHAARLGGMERQTLRDWVHRFNAEGVAGLRDRLERSHPPARAHPINLRIPVGHTGRNVVNLVLHKSVDTVSNIERGFSSTPIETAHVIATVLGVRLAELFEFEEQADSTDRDRRKAVERVVALITDKDEAILQTLGELLRVALKLRGQAEVVSP